MISAYERLKLKLTHIPPKSKGPTHKDWNTTPTEYSYFENGNAGCNVGLLHGLSRTCCLDIDDLELALTVEGMQGLIDNGIRYESGNTNRIKVLYRIPKEYEISLFTTNTLTIGGKKFGEFRCVARNGDSMQDVLPPSVHPKNDDWVYTWLDPLPKKWKKIPPLPEMLLLRTAPFLMGVFS